MKKITFLIALFLAASITLTTAGTTYKVLNNKVVALKSTSKTLTARKDTVYQVVDGVTFYKGAKGGIYYYRTSKKTGKAYKCYVK